MVRLFRKSEYGVLSYTITWRSCTDYNIDFDPMKSIILARSATLHMLPRLRTELKRTRSWARLRWPNAICTEYVCTIHVYVSLGQHSACLHQENSIIPQITLWQTPPKAKNFAETQSDWKACSFVHPASVANEKVGRYPVHSCSTSHFPFLHSNYPHHQVLHSKYHPLIAFYNRPHLCNPHSRSPLYDTLHSIAGLEPKYNRDYLDQR